MVCSTCLLGSHSRSIPSNMGRQQLSAAFYSYVKAESLTHLQDKDKEEAYLQDLVKADCFTAEKVKLLYEGQGYLAPLCTGWSWISAS